MLKKLKNESVSFYFFTFSYNSNIVFFSDEQKPSSSGVEPTDGEKDKKVSEEQNQPASPNALKLAAADCLNSWILYLQVCEHLQIICVCVVINSSF